MDEKELKESQKERLENGLENDEKTQRENKTDFEKVLQDPNLSFTAKLLK